MNYKDTNNFYKMVGFNYFHRYSYSLIGKKIREEIHDTGNFFEFDLSDILDEENYGIICCNCNFYKKDLITEREFEGLAKDSFYRTKIFYKEHLELLI